MPKRLAKQTIVLFRDGKRVSPAVGKNFVFTKEEYQEIAALNPDAIGPAVNEEVEDDDDDVFEEPAAPAKGGKAAKPAASSGLGDDL